MAGRLIAYDKNPGVRPIFHRRSIATTLVNCVLIVTKGEAQGACGIDQLCGGLQAAIEGGVHAMHSIWETHKMEEEWEFLLIDARNAFNESDTPRMAVRSTVLLQLLPTSCTLG